MKKINKVTNIALIFTLIGVVLTPARAYSADTIHLRVPIQPATYNRIKDIIKQDDSLVPDLKAQAFIDLEKEWKRISSKFSAQNVSNARRAYVGNTFLQYGIDEAVKPIIEDDISKAREGDKKLAYIVSCGQYTDISWLIYTLTELIPKAERPSWGISIIVTNIRSESLKFAASTIKNSSTDGLSIKGHYLNIDISSKEQANALDGLLVKYNLYGSVNGIMHNTGGNVISNAREYYKLLRHLSMEGSWLEIDRNYVHLSKKSLPDGYNNLFDLGLGSEYERLETTYLYNIADAGFSRVGDEDKSYAIFRTNSSGQPVQILAINQAFINLEKEWQDISSRFSAQNAHNAKEVYTGDTFLKYGIDEVMRPIIRDDVSKARKGDKKLTYIVSCGQKTDISWLTDTLAELIPKAERPSWEISIIVTNIRSESLKLAASAVEDSSISGLSIKGYYLNIDIRSKEQVNALDGLLAKYNLYGAADGIMHNMGGNVIENAVGYHKLLRRLAREGSWLEIDRRRIINTDYLSKIANAGFIRIGNENKFYTIFKAGSSVPETKIVIESFLKIPLAGGNIVIVNVMVGNQLYEISGIGVKKLLAVDLTSEVVKDPKECINIANLVNAVDGRLSEAAKEEKWDWWTPQLSQAFTPDESLALKIPSRILQKTI